MTESDKPSMFDSLLGKGEQALDKFMDDPAKVAKARERAEGMLAKHMDPAEADGVTNAAEDILRRFSDRQHGE